MVAVDTQKVLKHTTFRSSVILLVLAVLFAGIAIVAPFGIIGSVVVTILSILGLRRPRPRGASVLLWLSIAVSVLGVLVVAIESTALINTVTS
ncbi:hypothetical protein ACVXZ4_14245 [Lacisediminihabitans sp. FW035]